MAVVDNRQTLPFMFEEVKDSQIEWQMVLPFNPETYKMVYQPRANMTLTQGGVFEDNIGIAPPKFSISGVFGVVGTTVVGIGKSLLGDTGKNGMELYHEFEKQMLGFYERFGTYQMDGKAAGASFKNNPQKPYELRFYNFCDKEYWLIQINQFALTRSTQRRHLYQYDIQLTGLKRLTQLSMTDDAVRQNIAEKSALRQYEADALNAAKAAEAAKKMSTWDKFMATAQGMVKEVQGQVGKAMQAFAVVQGEVTKLKGMMNDTATAVANFKNGVTDMVHVPFDLIRTAKGSTDSVIKSLNDIMGLPHEFINDIRETKRLLMGYEQQPNLFRSPPTSTKTATDVTNTNPEILTTEVTPEMLAAGFAPIQIPEETLYASAIETPGQVTVAKQAIGDGDTMQTLANKTGVDWKQLAALNNLEYPYIATTTAQKYTSVLGTGYLGAAANIGDTSITVNGMTAKEGTVLLINGETPITVASVSGTSIALESPMATFYDAGTVVTNHERALSVMQPGDQMRIPGIVSGAKNINAVEEWEANLFGIDEELDEEGFMPDRGLGDITVRKGMSNLEMQLRHRIMTLRGELAELGHPEYGSLLPTFIGKINSEVWQERALVECQMAVMADPRVRAIGNVRFEVDNTAIFFEADVYPINQSNPLQVSLPLV